MKLAKNCRQNSWPQPKVLAIGLELKIPIVFSVPLCKKTIVVMFDYQKKKHYLCIAMENQENNLFVFRKFRLDEITANTEACLAAAKDKLQTLYPGKRITAYDSLTLVVETDSYYSETGLDTYDLGIIDDELYAIRNQRDGEVITFR